jgi:siroheme synthase-like protein
VVFCPENVAWGNVVAELYPIYADLTGRAVLVVGGGVVAARKVEALLKRQIRVTVVAPEICPELQKLTNDSGLVIHQRSYQKGDMAEHWLVIAATDNSELNQKVFAESAEARIFCNAVDQPELCTFHVPAVVRQGLLQIAISTGGASPALARSIRQELQEQFGPAYGELLEGLLELRNCFRQKYPEDAARRRELLESFLDSPEPKLLLEQLDSHSFAIELEKWKSR